MISLVKYGYSSAADGGFQANPDAGMVFQQTQPTSNLPVRMVRLSRELRHDGLLVGDLGAQHLTTWSVHTTADTTVADTTPQSPVQPLTGRMPMNNHNLNVQGAAISEESFEQQGTRCNRPRHLKTPVTPAKLKHLFTETSCSHTNWKMLPRSLWISYVASLYNLINDSHINKDHPFARVEVLRKSSTFRGHLTPPGDG